MSSPIFPRPMSANLDAQDHSWCPRLLDLRRKEAPIGPRKPSQFLTLVSFCSHARLTGGPASCAPRWDTAVTPFRSWLLYSNNSEGSFGSGS